jgi:hypothetical protein
MTVSIVNPVQGVRSQISMPEMNRDRSFMSEFAADKRMQALVAELLFKNELLRDAVSAKDECLRGIVRMLTQRRASACSCEAEKQLDHLYSVLRLEQLDREIRPQIRPEPKQQLS